MFAVAVGISGVAACGDDEGDDEALDVDSVEAKLAETAYSDASCTEGTEAAEGGGPSFECQAAVPAGSGVPGLAGQDATILVVEAEGELTATVTAGGQILDFFILD